MHITNNNVINVVNDKIYLYEKRKIFGLGRCGIRVGAFVLSPDGQWVAGRRLNSNLILEAGIFQSAGTLLTKARQYFRHSQGSMNVLVFKVWYDPMPSKVAMVAALWCKKGCAMEESEHQAVQFVSFGNRPPTAQELSEFDAGAGHGLSVPALTGVTGGADHVPSTDENKSNSVFELRLPAIVLFANLELIGPNPDLILNDLVYQLTDAKLEILDGIEADINRKVYTLSESELRQIVNDAEVQASHKFLHQFAVKELEALVSK